MQAFGAPGITPTWSSSAKDMVGCALGPSRVWFTTGYGIVNEVFWPRVDLPQIRDLGFIVADGQGFWVELKRHDKFRVQRPHAGTPTVEIIHKHEAFELRLRIAVDPQRDALLIDLGDSGTPGAPGERVDLSGFDLPVLLASAQELAAHEEVLAQIDKASAGKTVWRAVGAAT